jgi:WD40 repeat protein
MAAFYRYAAFISYSSKDAAFTRRLHRALEAYGIPKSLGAFDLIGNGKPNRIYPVFRDREELPTGQLDDLIKASLAGSAKLIVVCSPNAAQSVWVGKEIEHFLSLGRPSDVHAVIADSVDEETSTKTAFPLALQAARGLVAADARKSKDGFRNAWLKLIAGFIGVTPGQLIDRDKKRQRERAFLSGCAAALVVGFALAAAVTVDTRNARADLTAFAEQLVSEGLPLEAMSFAIAGLPAPGDVVPVTHPRAEDALIASGARIRLVAELDGYQVSASEDGRFLAAIGNDGAASLIGLTPPAARTQLGAVTNVTFSPDSRWLAIAKRDGSGELRSLSEGGETVALGASDPYNAFEFASDGQHLIVRTPSGRASLWTLTNALSASALGAKSAHFSPDGRRLLSYDEYGYGTLRAFDGSSAVVFDIDPRFDSFDDYGFSADDRFFLSRGGFGGGLLVDLAHPGPEQYLGHVDYFQFAANAPVLMTYERGVGATIHHLGDTLRSQPAGELLFAELSGDGRFVAGVTAGTEGERLGVTYDTTAHRQAAPLGPLELSPQLSFSADGRYLAYRKADRTGVLRDLRSGAETNLGLMSQGGLEFSPDDRFLMIHAESYFATLRVLESGEDLPLGPISSYEFSASGRFLMVSPFEEERMIVRDLDAGFAEGRGRTLRNQVCALNADAMRPFRASERAAGSGRRNINRRLEGRPWNPCDWRGLFSFEDGGEGWRQWQRLIAVRYFGAVDYACGEINAAGKTTPARREACARSQRQPPELWRPTDHPAL